MLPLNYPQSSSEGHESEGQRCNETSYKQQALIRILKKKIKMVFVVAVDIQQLCKDTKGQLLCFHLLPWVDMHLHGECFHALLSYVSLYFLTKKVSEKFNLACMSTYFLELFVSMHFSNKCSEKSKDGEKIIL